MFLIFMRSHASQVSTCFELEGVTYPWIVQCISEVKSTCDVLMLAEYNVITIMYAILYDGM